jgi:hypothetical protein
MVFKYNTVDCREERGIIYAINHDVVKSKDIFFSSE